MEYLIKSDFFTPRISALNVNIRDKITTFTKDKKIVLFYLKLVLPILHLFYLKLFHFRQFGDG